MNTPRPETPWAATLPPGQTNGLARFTEKILAELSSTREVQELVNVLTPRMIRLWAGDSTLRKMLTRPVENALRYRRPDAAEMALSPPLHTFLSDGDTAKLLLENMPFFINLALRTAGEFVEAVEALPSEEREKLLARVLTESDLTAPAGLITAAARIANSVHRENPTFLADHLGPAIRKIIERVDFGELEEVYFGSTEDIRALASAFTETLFEYPAKMVCMGGLVPGIANLVVAVLQENLELANTMSGELVAEILLSLLDDVDGESVGKLANELFEVVRKVHTGSALLGRPGRPELTAMLTKKLAQIGSAIDPRLLWKARVAITELKEARIAARIELLRNNPELLKERIKDRPSIKNADLRIARLNLELLEDMDDESLAGSISEGLSRLDAAQVAEAVNLFCGILNRVQREQPGFVGQVIHSFVNAVDTFEINETANWLAGDLAETLRPVARAALPGILSGLARWLEPEDDEYGPEIEDSLDALRQLTAQAEEA